MKILLNVLSLRPGCTTLSGDAIAASKDLERSSDYDSV